MPRVEPDAVGGSYPLHASTQVGIRCLDEGMVMIAQQAERMHTEPVSLNAISEKFQEVLVVAIVSEYCTALNPTIHAVVPATFNINS